MASGVATMHKLLLSPAATAGCDTLGLSISLRERSDSITIITLQTIGTLLYYRGNYDDMVVEKREERYYVIDDGIVLLRWIW
jgi:hypothetical protein